MTQPQVPTNNDPEVALIDSGVQSPDGSDGSNSEEDIHGSSIAGAIFNFTNCIVGAGAIGLGGAIASSGGAISIALILFFGFLTKLSLDLVIRLSVETEGAHGSFEDLANVGLGSGGRMVVLACKLLYSFGCLVAYVVVVKDNMASAVRDLIYGDSSTSGSWLYQVLSQRAWFTWIISLLCILPLCLLRDMTPLASFSLVSVASMVFIVGIVIYIFFACPDIGDSGGSVYENWFEVRPGVLESLGTFVFTFVSQHTVHLVFGSLKPNLRTVSNWKIVSAFSLLNATTVSLAVGVFVYMTFWQETKSDIFQIYPQNWMIDVAKLLLCVTMVLTFPLPFFTCRELLIMMLIHPFCGRELVTDDDDDNNNNNELQQPLLDVDDQAESQDADTISVATNLSRRFSEVATPRNWLLADDDRQLKLVGHIALTATLWFVTTGVAIVAPSLGDVLDLVGCASGTLIAFILPALLSLRLEGYSKSALLILVVGGAVGTVGTYFSVKKLYEDIDS